MKKDVSTKATNPAPASKPFAGKPAETKAPQTNQNVKNPGKK